MRATPPRTTRLSLPPLAELACDLRLVGPFPAPPAAESCDSEEAQGSETSEIAFSGELCWCKLFENESVYHANCRDG